MYFAPKLKLFSDTYAATCSLFVHIDKAAGILNKHASFPLLLCVTLTYNFEEPSKRYMSGLLKLIFQRVDRKFGQLLILQTYDGHVAVATSCYGIGSTRQLITYLRRFQYMYLNHASDLRNRKYRCRVE